MRLYQNLAEAYSEITRDLAKSPRVHSSQVQNVKVESELYESLGYAYAIADMPTDAHVIVETMVKHLLLDAEDAVLFRRWMELEIAARIYSDKEHTEHLHPDLSKLFEGHEPSYLYSDRMVGMFKILSRIFEEDLYTRRAYWPIFHPQDSMRASRQTRIPCTLGYQFLVRKNVNDEDVMSVIISQRSCDFGRFWFTDLWFGYKLLLEMVRRVRGDIKVGNTIHIVHSLHSFITEEVY